MDLSLFAGLLFGGIGSFVVQQTLRKRELIKLKKYFSSQQDSYSDEIQQQTETYIEQQLQYQQEISSLEEQLLQQAVTQAELTKQLDQEKELNKLQQLQLRENNQDIDEILESLEKTQQEVLDANNREIQTLEEENKSLAINLEQLKVELFNLQQQAQQTPGKFDSDNKDSSDWSPEYISELLHSVFPNIVLLRDSLNILAAQPENFVKLIKAIKDIYDGNPYSPIKVRATDKKWTECRVPSVHLMRIYFQKCKKESGYQILISPKKNQKSQDQDYEWLKSHQAC